MASDLNNQTHIHQLFLFKANDTMNVELVDFSPLLTGLFIFLYRHVCLKINILILTEKQTLTNTRTRTNLLLVSTVSILAVAGNSLVIYVVFTSRSDHMHQRLYTKSVHTQMIAKQEFTHIVHCSVEIRIQSSSLGSYWNYSTNIEQI